jgi:hypothetical protein
VAGYEAPGDTKAPNRMALIKQQHWDENTRETQRALATRQMMRDSEPETYMWAGHSRAIIRDFSTFVIAFEERLARALLIELGRRNGLLSVRDYVGHQLLLVDMSNNTFYNVLASGSNESSDTKSEPESMKEKTLRSVIAGAARVLNV